MSTNNGQSPLGLRNFLSGSSQNGKIERLKKGPEILVGTPGRIFELIKLKKDQNDEGNHHFR